MQDRHIIQTYCQNCQTIMDLCRQLEPDLMPGNRNPYSISPIVQVLSVLHVLATGSFQHTVALTGGMSQPMFTQVLSNVLCAFLQHLHHSYIKFPQRADMANVKGDFYQMGLIPHVVGAIDGTHLSLVPPNVNEQVQRNRKNYHSINVQVVCLADQYISQVTAKFPGSVPYPAKPEELRFNEAHGRTRRVLEHVFGPLKTRFRCLDLSQGALLYLSHKVGQIIVACCMLHNLAKVSDTIAS
ncbi:putative nuclease HARBI1 [Pleurodeles waltl]|uniref:putative nuclease HARBI1 n=1 Tax=Pleurodeles waltl TaxID=8319 RepID=UPI003709C5CF